MKRTLLLGAALALAFGTGLATQSIVGAQTAPPAPTAKTLMDEALVGGTFEQVMMQEVTLPPNAPVAWHIHPDGHEITFVAEGALKLKVDKQAERTFKAGDAFHINANVPHSGVAEASGAKLIVVRLKPKDKPVAQPVPAPTN
jgi:quercetin dioxygenase-like cupin family protein